MSLYNPCNWSCVTRASSDENFLQTYRMCSLKRSVKLFFCKMQRLLRSTNYKPWRKPFMLRSGNKFQLWHCTNSKLRNQVFRAQICWEQYCRGSNRGARPSIKSKGPSEECWITDEISKMGTSERSDVGRDLFVKTCHEMREGGEMPKGGEHIFLYGVLSESHNWKSF